MSGQSDNRAWELRPDGEITFFEYTRGWFIPNNKEIVELLDYLALQRARFSLELAEMKRVAYWEAETRDAAKESQNE